MGNHPPSLDETTAERSAAVLGYHEESKHHVGRMAPSLGYMDWANQPQPFRWYQDCETLPLPLLTTDPDLAYGALFSPPPQPAAPVTLATLGAVLELSLGLSAWKTSGASRWALRMAPSSGNLHPTEAYVIYCPTNAIHPETDLPPGVYHYAPLAHALECRLAIGPETSGAFEAALPTPGLWIAFTSIYWREAWKYGLRAYRYCQLDLGHALAGLSLAARLQAWHCRLVDGVHQADLGALLGFPHDHLPAAEQEHAECLCHLGPVTRALPQIDAAALRRLLPRLNLQGRPNRLSQDHEHWHGIDRISRQIGTVPWVGSAAEREPTWPDTPKAPTGQAAAVIRRRRSAVSYQPRQTMPLIAFRAILQRTLPRLESPPFAVGIDAPNLHLFLFVHRVSGLASGLYALCRHPAHKERLQAACNPAFRWRAADPALPLFRLTAGDFVSDAMHISCDQTIAGHGAFSLGMLAQFQPCLKASPQCYRALFWEAGLVGQLLYLEAEAQGFRGTGIGCFFDDAMHNLLGLQDRAFQSLYHFTVGRPVRDDRLKTLPAYHHRERLD